MFVHPGLLCLQKRQKSVTIGSYKKTGGYYMGTDVGYLRFIYYFGIIGLSTFILFFIKCAQYCAEGFHVSKWIFLSMLIANMAIWLKVSTDIFLVFAVFLCAANMQDEPEQIETDEDSI